MSRYDRKMKHSTRLRNKQRKGRHAGSNLGRQTATRQFTKEVQASDSGQVMSMTAYKRMKRLDKGVALTEKIYGNPGSSSDEFRAS